jgi:hypothetical protein
VLRAGGNYGWDPSKGGTDSAYDESVPMTDTKRFPDAVRPLWTSGEVTEAFCGAAFLTGSQWGPLEGRLAVVAVNGQKMLLFSMDPAGTITEAFLPTEFNDIFGRLRAVRSAPTAPSTSPPPTAPTTRSCASPLPDTAASGRRCLREAGAAGAGAWEGGFHNTQAAPKCRQRPRWAPPLRWMT